MAAAMPAIDLTEDDDDVLSKAHPTSCANPNHAVIVSSMRQQLLEQQRAKEVLQQRINSKDADIANRQARIADLQARDVGRLAEIRRLQARIDTLEDRLNSRGKRQQRVSYFPWRPSRDHLSFTYGSHGHHRAPTISALVLKQNQYTKT